MSTDERSIAVVVVSYNRIHDLARCLESLTGQVSPGDKIIVVDNGSTDGSPDMVARSFPGVAVIALGQNTGGAGGFSRGVQAAMDRGHGFAWLMDDDACPCPGAIDELRKAIRSLDGDFSFLASHVVDGNGQTISTHLPPPLGASLPSASSGILETSGHGYTQVEAGSFVGLLANLSVARETWLPIADFFIYHDDLEYSSRLATLKPAYFVSSSRVEHPDKRGSTEYGWRIYYEIRNRLWIAKSRDLASPRIRATVSRSLLRRTLVHWREASRKISYARLATRAWYDGYARSAARVAPQTREFGHQSRADHEA